MSMYALDTIRTLEREADELARMARAVEADARDLSHKIHAQSCTDKNCIDGWTIEQTPDGGLALVQHDPDACECDDYGDCVTHTIHLVDDAIDAPERRSR